jgi:urease accessory protein
MKPSKLLKFTAAAALIFALPALAQAHPGHDHDLVWDFASGVQHPLTGWDHLLAMIAVGVWAAQLGGRARWFVPSAFVGAMVVGAFAARTGLHVHGIESEIAASVFVFGLLIATSARVPIGAGMALVGAFAFFHGVAHGAEMPAGSIGLGYGAGFVATTMILQSAGLALGFGMETLAPRWSKFLGYAIAASGCALFAI